MQEPEDMIFEQDETDGFRVSLCPTESSKNGNGAVHGGVIFLLCEETMATRDYTVGHIGKSEDILFVVYTEREQKENTTVTRIISARRATSFERGLYYGKY